jgi:hypothetical protein
MGGLYLGEGIGFGLVPVYGVAQRRSAFCKANTARVLFSFAPPDKKEPRPRGSSAGTSGYNAGRLCSHTGGYE